MVNYENAKIYLLKSKNSDKVYVGSTCEKYLSTRLAKHRFNQRKQNKKISAREIYVCGDIYIELYECFKCSCKEELLRREREVIEVIDCVNIRLPITSIEEKKQQDKEYNQLNKEKLKKYRELNKDNKQEYDKRRNELNKEKIKQKNKEYRELNKEKILLQSRKKFLCDCGREVQQRCRKRHLNSDIHKELMNDRT
jgi:hypothetical protein